MKFSIWYGFLALAVLNISFAFGATTVRPNARIDVKPIKSIQPIGNVCNDGNQSANTESCPTGGGTGTRDDYLREAGCPNSNNTACCYKVGRCFDQYPGNSTDDPRARCEDCMSGLCGGAYVYRNGECQKAFGVTIPAGCPQIQSPATTTNFNCK